MNKNIISVLILLLVLGGGIVFYNLNKISGVTENNNGPVVDTSKNTEVNSVAETIVSSMKSDSLGEYLTDTKGMTLYVFADDKKLQSTCTGSCLLEWPLFEYDNKTIASFTDTLSKRMNAIERSGEVYQQYAYDGKPLYYYVGDKNIGEVNGNGLENGKWSIVLIIE